VTPPANGDVTTVLLTGAGGSASANFLHALRMAPSAYRVIGADVSPVKLHLSDADERFLLPRADDPRYLEALTATLREVAADVLHVQPDPEVLVVGAARAELPVSTFLPAQRALEIAADKALFAERMDLAGVAVPDSLPIRARNDVAPTVDKLLSQYRQVWVRARVGAGSKASLPVRSGDQALHWIDWWCHERGMRPSDFMCGEMLPGREFAYQSIWQNSELIVGQARERIEYLYGFRTPSGQTSTPAVARTVREPGVDELAARAIRVLDPSPHGVYCVDIKTGEDGTPKVTEINAGRFFTTSNFFAAAGLNMPDMSVRAAKGEELTAIGSSPLDPDLYWLRMVDMGFRLVPGDELEQWPRCW
jgi:carbamoyl-phosphate synthase large subunit